MKKMELLSVKYLTLIIGLLLSLEINKGQLSQGYEELVEISLSQDSKNESPERNCQNLELKESKSIPNSQGEKVETIVLSCPLSKHSEVRLFNASIIQKILLSKKDFSLTAHYFQLISKTLKINPVVNILRI
jgi:hypothetical protein